MEEEQIAQRFIKPGSHKGKGLAVFTSGGDSQGKKLIKLNPKNIFKPNFPNFNNLNIWISINYDKS